ncbi:hypothetical protein [uncultured Ruegeria sp.]|uniref:hypothetical protein n=1 Tax=uncultured Ruegeria sp. TaxID=259304 RepID=UPI002623E34D|nr:hypothetical protein [uncultured Ruegeria sp.]
MFEPSTPGSAVANAYRLKRSNSDYDAAMWAACMLMALHKGNSDVLREYAHLWANKAKSGGSENISHGQTRNGRL